jgi:hypothetical protein
MANEKRRIFIIETNGTRRLIRSVEQPRIVPEQEQIIGPFRTRRAAMFAKNHPEITTVAEAEKKAKEKFRGADTRNKFFAGVRKLMQQYGIDNIQVWDGLGTAGAYDKDGKGLFAFNSVSLSGDDDIRDYDIH